MIQNPFIGACRKGIEQIPEVGRPGLQLSPLLAFSRGSILDLSVHGNIFHKEVVFKTVIRPFKILMLKSVDRRILEISLKIYSYAIKTKDWLV